MEEGFELEAFGCDMGGCLAGEEREKAHGLSELENFIVRTKVLEIRHPAIEVFTLIGWQERGYAVEKARILQLCGHGRSSSVALSNSRNRRRL